MNFASELQFQKAIIAKAQAQGWRYYHNSDSRRATPGWPDLVLVRPPEILFVELKTNKGQAKQTQLETLNLLSQCNETTTYIWRPKHWDAIMEILQ